MESSVLAAVSPVEAQKNPWGLSKMNVPSLMSVMDEELAKEIDKNEGFSSWEETVGAPVECKDLFCSFLSTDIHVCKWNSLLLVWQSGLYPGQLTTCDLSLI